MRHTLCLAALGSLGLALTPAIASAQTQPQPVEPVNYGPAPQVIYAPPPTMYAPAPMPLTVRTRPVREEYHGGRVPDGATVVTEYNRPLLVAGALTFGIPYLISVIDAFASCPPGASEASCQANTGWLYVPVIGPFLAAADSRASYGGRNLAILDGVLQVGGVALIISGLLASHQYLEHPASTTAHASTRPQWGVVPMAAGADVGATLTVIAM